MPGYLEHFGLDTLPFATAPDPRFAFATRAHEIELLRMQDSVEQRLGLCLLRGEIGTGKSTIAHMLMKSWGADSRFVAAYISDPSAPSQPQFLRVLVSAFGLEPSRYAETNKSNLRGFLLDNYEAGRTVIILIDEAQSLSAANMATIQQLSNEQTSDTKLIQIALLAQPNFDRKLSYQPALRSRIARRGTLDPLIFEDAVDMMRYRVQVAGGDFDALFPVALHRSIYNATQGIPRQVCVLCDNILFNTFARGLTAADAAATEDAIRKCDFPTRKDK